MGLFLIAIKFPFICGPTDGRVRTAQRVRHSSRDHQPGQSEDLSPLLQLLVPSSRFAELINHCIRGMRIVLLVTLLSHAISDTLEQVLVCVHPTSFFLSWWQRAPISHMFTNIDDSAWHTRTGDKGYSSANVSDIRISWRCNLLRFSLITHANSS